MSPQVKERGKKCPYCGGEQLMEPLVVYGYVFDDIYRCPTCHKTEPYTVEPATREEFDQKYGYLLR